MKTLIKIVIIVCLSYIPLVYADVAIIVNTNNSNTLSDNDISRLFLAKMKSFDSGNKALPINLKVGNSVRDEFEEKVLKKNSQQVKAYWSKLVFSGKGKPPKEKSSDAEIIAFIISNPGAIGYVDAASVNDKVKVVKVF